MGRRVLAIWLITWVISWSADDRVVLYAQAKPGISSSQAPAVERLHVAALFF